MRTKPEHETIWMAWSRDGGFLHVVNFLVSSRITCQNCMSNRPTRIRSSSHDDQPGQVEKEEKMSDLSKKSARELLSSEFGSGLSVADYIRFGMGENIGQMIVVALSARDERLTRKLREIKQFCEQYTFTGQNPGLMSAIINIIGDDA